MNFLNEVECLTERGVFECLAVFNESWSRLFYLFFKIYFFFFLLYLNSTQLVIGRFTVFVGACVSFLWEVLAIADGKREVIFLSYL